MRKLRPAPLGTMLPTYLLVVMPLVVRPGARTSALATRSTRSNALATSSVLATSSDAPCY